MITIIDYKSGNLKSISNGFKKIGEDFQITDDIEEIANAKHLVLPGVGAFGDAITKLKESGLDLTVVGDHGFVRAAPGDPHCSAAEP